MISYEKALEILLNNKKLPSKTIAINQSLDHVCAKDTYCNSFVPPFANSAMDGLPLKALTLPMHQNKTP